MRVSALLYPIVNVLHLLGLVMLLGSMMLLDLRLLGVGREFDLRAVSARLTPVAVAGLVILLLSGFCQFAADAAALAANSLMQVKVALVVVGIGNALLFRHGWRARMLKWDEHPPMFGRLQALVSLLIWIAVLVVGRLIAYF